MKKTSLIVWVSVAILSSVTLITCAKSVKKYGDIGVIVRISPSGLVESAENWDGSEIEYETADKQFPGSLLAFFDIPGEQGKATGFMKKEEGKWKKKELLKGLEDNKRLKGNPVMSDGIVVNLGPDGNILRVSNLDGSAPDYSEPLEFTNARCYVHNGCCWKKVYGVWKCRSSYCP